MFSSPVNGGSHPLGRASIVVWLLLVGCTAAPSITASPPLATSSPVMTATASLVATASPTLATPAPATPSPTEAGPLRVVMGVVAGQSGFEAFFRPSAIEVTAGDPSVYLVNQSEVAHNMLIGTEVNGERLAASERIEPASSGTFTFAELAPGSYTIWCSIEDHYELGMFGTLTIKP